MKNRTSTYQGEQSNRVAFPLGGIGAGMISLEGTGATADATPSSRGEGSGAGTATGAILLLPAWPEDWHADFRMHVPGKTVVEGSVRDGHLTELRVRPASRRLDVVAPCETETMARPDVIEKEDLT